jgi:peptide/nickel transport system permease protein
MLRFTLIRLGQTLITAVFVSMIVFGLARLTGDPALTLLPTEATVDDRNFFRNQYGLDKPLYLQYLTFAKNVLKGDLGLSFKYREPAFELVLDGLTATLTLGVTAMILAVLIALPLGIFSAIRRDTWIDQSVRWMAALGQSTPSFWLGLLLIMFFAVYLGWFPTSGHGELKHLVLPAITLSFFTAGAIARLTRSNMLEAMRSDFVRFERLSGVSEWRVVTRHALRNAAIPIVTFVALQFGVLLSGAVVTETVFAWPGIGRIVIEAINTRDYPVLQAAVLVSAFLILILNLLVDLLYAWLDPRIAFSSTSG